MLLCIVGILIMGRVERVCEMAGYVFGIDVGGTTVKLGLFDLHGMVVDTGVILIGLPLYVT